MMMGIMASFLTRWAVGWRLEAPRTRFPDGNALFIDDTLLLPSSSPLVFERKGSSIQQQPGLRPGQILLPLEKIFTVLSETTSQ